MENPFKAPDGVDTSRIAFSLSLAVNRGLVAAHLLELRAQRDHSGPWNPVWHDLMASIEHWEFVLANTE